MENFLKIMADMATQKKKKEKYMLFENEECPACNIVTEVLNKEIKEGNIEVEYIDVLSDKGKNMAKRLNVKAVPTLFKLEGARLVEEILEFEEEDSSEEPNE
jgi:thiol-disulfide isomerase/thioredoxin